MAKTESIYNTESAISVNTNVGGRTVLQVAPKIGVGENEINCIKSMFNSPQFRLLWQPTISLGTILKITSPGNRYLRRRQTLYAFYHLSHSHSQNSQDMSPNYAGTIVGVANTIASSAGFASPIVTGYLTDGQVKKKFSVWGTCFEV